MDNEAPTTNSPNPKENEMKTKKPCYYCGRTEGVSVRIVSEPNDVTGFPYVEVFRDLCPSCDREYDSRAIPVCDNPRDPMFNTYDDHTPNPIELESFATK